MNLEPCPNPWCLSEVDVLIRKGSLTREAPDQVQIECGCGIYGPACDTLAEAIAAWNTRPQPRSDAGEVLVDTGASAPPVSGTDEEGLMTVLMSAIWPLLGGNHTDAEAWHEISAALEQTVLPVLRAVFRAREAAAIAEDRRGRTFSPTEIDAAYAAGRADGIEEAAKFLRDQDGHGEWQEAAAAILELGDKP